MALLACVEEVDPAVEVLDVVEAVEVLDDVVEVLKDCESTAE